MNNIYFVLYGLKDKDIYYIVNTNPILWGDNLIQAKRYYDKHIAEKIIIRDNYNYEFINNMIKNHALDSFYVATIENNVEVGRMRLL